MTIELLPTYVALRRDFVFNVPCCRCRRTLPTNIAIILRDEQGKEGAFGPVCATKALGHPVGSIPNLTLAAILVADSDKKEPASVPPDEVRPPKGQAGDSVAPVPRRSISPEDRDAERAATYLVLRLQQLPLYPGVFYRPLQEAYDAYRDTGQLDADQVAHILKIEAYNAKNLPRYSLANLLTVYAFDRALFAALDHVPEDRRGFLKGMRRALRRELALSKAQVEAIAKWLALIPNQPVLDASGFDWSWTVAAEA